eukprot:2611743-Pyramimonas_sp.AAC.1
MPERQGSHGGPAFGRTLQSGSWPHVGFYGVLPESSGRVRTLAPPHLGAPSARFVAHREFPLLCPACPAVVG